MMEHGADAWLGRRWRGRWTTRLAVLLVLAVSAQVVGPRVAGADLYFGRTFDIGPYRFKVVKPHVGNPGPNFGKWSSSEMRVHINVHIEKRNDRAATGGRPVYRELRNFHLTPYREDDGRLCLYVWESVRRTEHRWCLPGPSDTIGEAVEALLPVIVVVLAVLLLTSAIPALIDALGSLVVTALRWVPAVAVIGLAAESLVPAP